MLICEKWVIQSKELEEAPKQILAILRQPFMVRMIVRKCGHYVGIEMSI